MKWWIAATALACASAATSASHEWVKAEVVQVDAQRLLVTLKHEHIKSIDMDAMTMPFKAEKDAHIERFKRGDRVRFTFVDKDDHLVVEQMEWQK